MTPDTPWFRAEHRPERHEGEGPTVDLIRRGPPLTGNPDLDCWADRGCVYGLSLADAIALRGSLTAAIEEAGPKAARAARTCWTCRWAVGRDCKSPAYRADTAVDVWIGNNIDWDTTMPLPTATPCPGFTEKL